ncbi:MAG: biopolymer transporter ExbD [Gammaproteobacteria bacterium]
MKRHWRRKRHTEAPELNITAFMNLMVILVPFLLITAVFSRITILELEIPAEQDALQSEPEKEAVNLQVIVFSDSIEFGDQKTNKLTTLPAMDDASELIKLNQYLQQIKAAHPDTTDITLLLSANIPYGRVIDVMDSIRGTIAADGQTAAELFPAISIGDAPNTPSGSEP